MAKAHTNMSGVTIYKRTATGKVQEWKQELDGRGCYRTVTGQRGGKCVTSEWVQCRTTNEGQANERGPISQAQFEVNANYKKKLDKEYHRNLTDIDTPKVFLPMLAKEFKNYKDKLDISKGVYVQPKLDGMRCIADRNGLWSRNGKPVLSVPHIAAALAPLFEDDPHLILDGELYNHEYADDFNQIISSSRMLKPTAEDLALSKKIIQYHVYDLPRHPGGFGERYNAMQDLLDALGHASVVMVQTAEVFDFGRMEALYEVALAAGYEGCMVRLDTPYENKRTSNLLKRKETQSGEFEVLDIMPGKGNWAGKAKRALVKLGRNKQCEVGVKGSMEFCAQILAEKEKHIGQLAKVDYFGYTPDGVLRFGRVTEFSRADVGRAVKKIKKK